MKPTGPTLAAYGDPTASRLVVWYAGTDQDARMEGGDCPAYLSALLDAGCFVVRVAPTVVHEDGRQWTEETARDAMTFALAVKESASICERLFVVGFSNGTTGACWGCLSTDVDGLALLCGSGLTHPVNHGMPVYLGFGSRDRKVTAATAAARVEAWRQHSRHVVTATHDNRHEVSEAHLAEVLRTFGLGVGGE
jgi:predicted esterase